MKVYRVTVAVKNDRVGFNPIGTCMYIKLLRERAIGETVASEMMFSSPGTTYVNYACHTKVGLCTERMLHVHEQNKKRNKPEYIYHYLCLCIR